MKRFFTPGLLWNTLAEAVVLIIARFARGKYPLLDAIVISLMMLPFSYAANRVRDALPSWQKPSDDGLYSIAGKGLSAIQNAREEKSDWQAVVFYATYVFGIVLVWFIVMR